MLSSVIIPFQRHRTMALRTELVISYDYDMFPVSAACACCGEEMPKPPEDIEVRADIILWFSVRFLEHKGQKHPASRKSDDAEMFSTDEGCRID